MTGLVALLMISSVAVNELIIRNLQSIQRVEASNRAYMAAEAGVEDALYELTPHFAGYKTPDLTDPNVRKTDFEGKAKCDPGDFCNKWTVESRSGLNKWRGKIYKNQKVILALYNDSHVPSSTPGINSINSDATSPSDISALNVSGDFKITFIIPDTSNIFALVGKLKIDNDGDFGVTVKNNGVNEDPKGIPTVVTCPNNPEDDDCDGQVDEDNSQNAVILWKLTDGGSLSLIPIKGCLEAPLAQDKGSDPCEDDFGPGLSPIEYAVTLDQNDEGKNEQGNSETVGAFISRATANPNAKLHLEFHHQVVL